MGEYGFKILARLMSSGLKYSGLIIGFGGIASEMDDPHKYGFIALGGIIYLLGSFVQEGNELANNNMIIDNLRGKGSKLEEASFSLSSLQEDIKK